MKEGRTSQTALGVAVWMLLGIRRTGAETVLPEGAEGMTRALLETVPRGKRWAAMLTGSGLMEKWARLHERVWFPGMSLHIRTRKRYIDDAARAALSEGAEQVVVLGAGLDTLAARLAPAFPGARFFEVDHPPTQELKRKALRQTGHEPPNLNLLAVDFTRSRMDEALRTAKGFDPDVRTFFVAEGLTMYLDAASVDRLFGGIRSVSPPGSRLAFTFVEMEENGRMDLGRFTWILLLRMKMAGEPFVWGVRRERLGKFLDECGFHLLDAPDIAEIRRRYLQDLGDPPLPGWEHLALAEVG